MFQSPSQRLFHRLDKADFLRHERPNVSRANVVSRMPFDKADTKTVSGFLLFPSFSSLSFAHVADDGRRGDLESQYHQLVLKATFTEKQERLENFFSIVKRFSFFDQMPKSEIGENVT